MANKQPKPNLEEMMLMVNIVTGKDVTVACAGDSLKINTADPISVYKLLKDERIIRSGDFSGVKDEEKQKFREKEFWVKTGSYYGQRYAYGPNELIEEGYDEMRTVPDGTERVVEITRSKRADIRREEKALFLAEETIDAEALKLKYQSVLSKGPIEDILEKVVSKKTAQSLTRVFNAVKNIKPLSVEKTLDKEAVKSLQESYEAAIAGLKTTVINSGILEILPKEDVKKLVKRAVGVDVL